MDDFIGEEIDVEQAPESPRPVRFTWRNRTYEIAEVLASRVDIGFGDHPPRSRKWYTRRHRRCYTVRDTEGSTFEIYLDYSDKRKHTWWLTRQVPPE